MQRLHLLPIVARQYSNLISFSLVKSILPGLVPDNADCSQWFRLATTLADDSDLIASSSGKSNVDLEALKNFRFGPRKVADLKRPKGLATGLEGVVYIVNTYNNIFCTLVNKEGTSLKTSWSAGCLGFRHRQKSTPLAAEKLGEEIGKKALKLGYENVVIKLKGPGRTKMFAVQGLHASGLRITQLQDVTPTLYNGCRPKKKRRV